LKTGAIVFALSGVALLVVPAIFLDLLAFPTSADLEWSMRMIGITVAALAGNMWNTATRAGSDAVRRAARIMQVSAFGLGVVTLLTPHAITWFVITYAIVGFGFSIAYTLALRAHRPGSAA